MSTRRLPHERGYWKQMRQHRKKYLLGEGHDQTPKRFVYTIPGTQYYTSKPKSKHALRIRLFIAWEQNRTNKILYTKETMMKFWDTFWDASRKNPNESCASIANRATKRLEQLQTEFVKWYEYNRRSLQRQQRNTL